MKRVKTNMLLHANIILMLLSFSKEISGFADLKRKIREQDKSPGNVNGNASEARVHKKKKDVVVSPLKPPNG